MATIKDVARSSGVSVATASRALNSSPLVREATRVRVDTAAQALGYSPHGAALSLITRRTRTLGLLLPDLYGEFFSELIRGVDEVARREGYHLLVTSAHRGQEETQGALRSFRGRVDGLITMTPHLDSGTSREALSAHCPVVSLCSPPGGLDVASVAIANFEGAYAMLEHLASLGHRRIAIICGDSGNFDATERLRGYRAARENLALDNDPDLEFPGDFSEAAGHEAAGLLLALGNRPTAVFAANDGMAIGAISALREAGVRIPEDMALGGFDDIPMARYVDPPLTSVHVDIRALGARAAERLLAGVRDRAQPDLRRETLPTTLVVRRSCGANRG